MPRNQFLRELGPLNLLIGTWEGEKGIDVSPSNSRAHQKNLFREKMTFSPFGPVENHQQKLFGLRYKTTAWKLGDEESFHEEVGYWLWDAKESQVMRCFMIPRGVIVMAGGKVNPRATEFALSARVGSPTYGICSNLFLDREFKTVRYDFRLRIEKGHILTYEEDTHLKIKGRRGVFHHRDQNILNLCE